MVFLTGSWASCGCDNPDIKRPLASNQRGMCCGNTRWAVSGAVREAEGSRLVLRLLDCPFNSELIIVVHFLII